MYYGESAREPKSPDPASHLVLLLLFFLGVLHAGIWDTCLPMRFAIGALRW